VFPKEHESVDLSDRDDAFVFLFPASPDEAVQAGSLRSDLFANPKAKI
jgi:hypothetical protein